MLVGQVGITILVGRIHCIHKVIRMQQVKLGALPGFELSRGRRLLPFVRVQIDWQGVAEVDKPVD